MAGPRWPVCRFILHHVPQALSNWPIRAGFQHPQRTACRRPPGRAINSCTPGSRTMQAQLLAQTQRAGSSLRGTPVQQKQRACRAPLRQVRQ